MSSSLERIPLDVLAQIAFFSADPVSPPSFDSLLQLLLTSRTLYRLLSIRTCPQLYADLFRVTFDLSAYFHKSGRCAKTSSYLARELQRRAGLLRRIRLRQMTNEHLLSDLWGIHLMLLESDSLNETHLHSVGVAQWILGILENYCPATGSSDQQTAALAIAVASLVLSRDDISALRPEVYNRTLHSIRPFTTCKLLVSTATRYRAISLTNRMTESSWGRKWRCCTVHNGLMIFPPSLSSSSIFLTFALKEAIPLQVPPHLPATRAEAIAVGNDGPTKEDFFAVTATRTPLLADSFRQSQSRESVSDLSRERRRPSRSTMHNEDFHRVARCLDLFPCAQELEAYLPSLLTGIWEGSYMVAPSLGAAAHPFGTEGNEDFLCRQPIQFRLEEYLSFAPWLPLPIDCRPSMDSHVLQNLSDRYDEKPSRSVQFFDGDTGRCYHYEPLCLSGVSKTGRNTRHALDVVIIGETPRRFQVAWGAYKYIGRVRLSDGLISLMRRPLDAAEDGSGIWVFEGYLHSRRTFVGRWNSLGTDEPGVRGVFSVSKTADE
ncbi:hypothetical protein EDC04DRAFT_2570531 [Pisolithus marmoratus]|nr:hypothetical protein EDC04DRAFT_2570531 [Pisolithus marmoratus]